MRGYCLLDKNQNILTHDDLFEQSLLLDLKDCTQLTIGSLFDTTLSFEELLSQSASRRIVPALHRHTGNRYQLEIVPLPTEQETLFVLLVEQKTETSMPKQSEPTFSEALVGGEKPADIDPFFDVSPLPMWIFNTDTLEFVAVNEAAVQKYGWSRQEFLNMTILDIRPKSERERVGRIVSGCLTRIGRSGPWLHQNRNGQSWSVDALTHAVIFRGKPCRLVKVIDMPAEASHSNSLDDNSSIVRSLHLAEAREARIVEMKQEINELLGALGREPKFQSVRN